MSVPSWLGITLGVLNDAFLGTLKWSFGVILLLIIVKLASEFLKDLLFHNVKRYLWVIFFPGSFFHVFWHSLTIKLLGYELTVNFHMFFDRPDISSQSLRGELRNPFHAFLIGIAPLLNFALFFVLNRYNTNFREYFTAVNFKVGWFFMVYVIISLFFFGLPDFGDLLLPFYSATAYQTEIIFLLLVGFICYVISIAYWGWLIPSINFTLYCIVLVYLVQKQFFKKRAVNIMTKAFEDTTQE